jgi:hypothetical protein
MNTPSNLFEQTNELERSAIAIMLGFSNYADSRSEFSGFRIALRGIPAVQGAPTIGDLTQAYLMGLSKYLEAVMQPNHRARF